MWYPTPVLTSLLETSAWPDNLLRDQSAGGEWGERLAALVCRFWEDGSNDCPWPPLIRDEVSYSHTSLLTLFMVHSYSPFYR